MSELTPEQRAKMSGEASSSPLESPFQNQNTQDPFVSNVTTVLVIATLLYVGFQMRSCAAPPTPEQTAQANREQESKVSDYKTKYNAIAEVLSKPVDGNKSGFQVTIDPFDNEYPSKWRLRASWEIDSYSARKLAKETYERCGNDCIIRVYDGSGKEVAKASEFGVE